MDWVHSGQTGIVAACLVKQSTSWPLSHFQKQEKLSGETPDKLSEKKSSQSIKSESSHAEVSLSEW